MPTWEQLWALSQAPASVLLVLLVTVILVGAIRRWWVPGWLYDKSELRGDKLEAAMQKLTDAVEMVTDDRQWNDRDRQTIRRNRDA